MKCHKYKVGDKVIINNPKHSNVESLKGLKGKVKKLWFGEVYDYLLYTDRGLIKVSESEIILHNNEIKIALAGKMRSGKDSIGEYAIWRYSFKRFAFGDGIRKVCNELFPDQMKGAKNRLMLQKFGQMMRYEFDHDVWVNYCFNEINKSDTTKIIITDLRQPNEYLRCKDENFIIVKVHADDKIRLHRMNAKGDNFKLEDLNHETEQYIDDFEYDYIINNNGDLPSMRLQFDSIIEEITR